MKIGLITTLNTNIGDDFIREGILHALRSGLPEIDFEFVMINKHNPYTLYPKWHPVYWTKFVPKKRHVVSRLVSRLTAWTGGSVFEDCDAIIQCGAPVYWYGCHRMESAELFWRGIASRLSKKIAVLNLAAGSCYPWERIPETIDDEKDAAYMKSIFEICRKTIVRDPKSDQLLKTLGCSPVLLPCSAFLAAVPYQDLERTEEYVFVNYMPGGSHYDFEQGIDAEQWKNTMLEFVQRAANEHNVAFICHNQKEHDAAEDMAPEITRFWPKTVEEYFKLAVKGKVGVFNRMHASVGFAGLGIPSIAIGADTRMLMVENIGLEAKYVKEVTAEYLHQQLNRLIAERGSERDRLLCLQKDTLIRYADELQGMLS